MAKCFKSSDKFRDFQNENDSAPRFFLTCFLLIYGADGIMSICLFLPKIQKHENAHVWNFRIKICAAHCTAIPKLMCSTRELKRKQIKWFLNPFDQEIEL